MTSCSSSSNHWRRAWERNSKSSVLFSSTLRQSCQFPAIAAVATYYTMEHSCSLPCSCTGFQRVWDVLVPHQSTRNTLCSFTEGWRSLEHTLEMSWLWVVWSWTSEQWQLHLGSHSWQQEHLAWHQRWLSSSLVGRFLCLGGAFLNQRQLEDTPDSSDWRTVQGSYPLSDNRRRGMRRVPSHAWERQSAASLCSHSSVWSCRIPSACCDELHCQVASTFQPSILWWEKPGIVLGQFSLHSGQSQLQ